MRIIRYFLTKKIGNYDRVSEHLEPKIPLSCILRQLGNNPVTDLSDRSYE